MNKKELQVYVISMEQREGKLYLIVKGRLSFIPHIDDTRLHEPRDDGGVAGGVAVAGAGAVHRDRGRRGDVGVVVPRPRQPLDPLRGQVALGP